MNPDTDTSLAVDIHPIDRGLDSLVVPTRTVAATALEAGLVDGAAMDRNLSLSFFQWHGHEQVERFPELL